ncbi:MAG: hypothetical protein RR840_09020 [Clostridium sp.]
MFRVIVKNHIRMGKNRWIISEAILLLVAIEFMYSYSGELSKKGIDPLFWDYIIDSLINSFFIIVIIPILYVIITGSLFADDIENGIITSYISRANNRFEYFISVLGLMLISAIVLTLLFLVNLVIVALVAGMAITDNTNYHLIDGAYKLGQNIWLLLITQISIVSLGITSIGVICNVVALFIRKFKCEIIIIMLLLYQGGEAYFHNRKMVKYSLIAQMKLDIHYPYILYHPTDKVLTPEEYVSVMYCYSVFIGVILIFGLIGYLYITRSDINRRQ